MTIKLRFMPCVEFEAAIHDFVDQGGSLPEATSTSNGPAAPAAPGSSGAPALSATDLLVHLELCPSCRQAVEAVRQQIRAHRDAVDFGRVLAGFDPKGAFQKLNGELFAGNVARLAELVYELGKAYFLAGNDSKLVTFLHKKAQAIERSRAEGRRVAKETEALGAAAGAAAGRMVDRVKRTRVLLRGQGRGLAAAGRTSAASGDRAQRNRNSLDNARRFLEECLILDPAHAPARIYLGYYFVRIDRPEEGLAEFRRVLALPGLNKTLRVMTLQAMGNAHAYRLDYEKAIECFEEIVRLGILDEDPRFFTVLLSLAMFQAKLGRYDLSTATFGELVRRFPDQLEKARSVLEQAQVFRRLLGDQAGFRMELCRRYPMLFAG